MIKLIKYCSLAAVSVAVVGYAYYIHTHRKMPPMCAQTKYKRCPSLRDVYEDKSLFSSLQPYSYNGNGDGV